MTAVYTPFPTNSMQKSITIPDGMEGLFRQALGKDFDRIHPMLQARFGLHASGGIACIGEGMMNRMSPGGLAVKAFLALGSRKHILFPKGGEEVPFALENYPYIDKNGNEALTFVHTFYFPDAIRRFDFFMYYDRIQNDVSCLVGKGQGLVTDLQMEVDSRGHVLMRTGRLDWFLGKSRLPALLGGYAEVEEWYDEVDDCIRIRVSIAHPFFGKIYAYEGWFRCTFVQAEEVPRHVLMS